MATGIGTPAQRGSGGGRYVIVLNVGQGSLFRRPGKAAGVPEGRKIHGGRALNANPLETVVAP